MTNNLVNRLLWCHQWDTVFKITGIEPPMESCENMGDMLRFIDLRTGKEMITNWVSEIGEHFQLVPLPYPEKKAVAFCEAINDREKSNYIAHGLWEDMELLLMNEKTERCCNGSGLIEVDGNVTSCPVCEAEIQKIKKKYPAPEPKLYEDGIPF